MWQTNRALTELGHEVELLTEADIRRRIGHHNVHYAFELPYRVLEVVRGRLARGAFDVLLISQPYGYRLGQWVRAERRRGRRAPVYLHRSHGHELVAAAQMAALRDQLSHDARPGGAVGARGRWRDGSRGRPARRCASLMAPSCRASSIATSCCGARGRTRPACGRSTMRPSTSTLRLRPRPTGRSATAACSTSGT